MIAWSESAGSLADLQNIKFTLVLDGVPTALANATCTKQASALVLDCRAPLPPLSDGRHEIQVVSVFRSGRAKDSSAPSLALIIYTKAGRSETVADPRPSPPPARGGAEPARNVTSPIARWASGLDQPRLLAPASPDRVFFVSGSSHLYSATPRGAAAVATTAATSSADRVVAVAVSPQFDETRAVFVAWSAPGTRGQRELQVRRYSWDQNRLSDEKIIGRVSASKGDADAPMAFGPDGKLYLVVPDSPRSSIYRFHNDGTTPEEQRSKGVLFAYGPPNASALAWNPRTSELWCVGAGSHGAEMLVFPSPDRLGAASLPIAGHPPAASQANRRNQASHVSSLAFVNRPNASVSDLFVAVDDRNGEVVRLEIADNGAIRIAGQFPSGPEGRVTALAALGADLFIVRDKPGERAAGTIAVASASIARP